MRRWKQYFYATLNIKDATEIREKVIYQGPEEQITPPPSPSPSPTNEEVWEIIRTLTLR